MMERGEDQAPDMPAEQAADLAALVAASSDGGAVPGQDKQDAANDPAEEWAQVPAIVGAVLSMAMPELAEVYTPERCRAWGAAMVPLADQYGWNSSELLGRFGPWVGLASATVPLAWPTVQAIKARRSAANRGAQDVGEGEAGMNTEPAADAPASSGGFAAAGVTFGGVGSSA
ncbi:MAG: hypothetical protein AB1592_18860 [Pseudomonadota bacterium]